MASSSPSSASPYSLPRVDTVESLLDDTLRLVDNETPSPSNLLSANLEKIKEMVSSQKQTSSGIVSKFRLDGQIALVTGGSRGIGLAFAHALGEAGCKVAVVSVNLANAERAALELSMKGIESLAIEADVSKKEDAERMVRMVLEMWGDLHIAVNNAGITKQGNAETFSEADWDQVMDINLKGVFLCSQAEAKHMLSKGRGKIINTASISANMINRPQKQAAYNTSKSGVVQLTKAMAAEWADRGVTVNSISPGYIDTDMIKAEHLMPLREEWTSLIPMKRFGLYEELQGAVVFLASQLSNYMTGSDIVIDGGYLLW